MYCACRFTILHLHLQWPNWCLTWHTLYCCIILFAGNICRYSSPDLNGFCILCVLLWQICMLLEFCFKVDSVLLVLLWLCTFPFKLWPWIDGLVWKFPSVQFSWCNYYHSIFHPKSMTHPSCYRKFFNVKNIAFNNKNENFATWHR